jgi:hypothetical protein
MSTEATVTAKRRTMGVVKAWQTRGSGWIQFVVNTGIITANVALFYDYLLEWGINLQLRTVLAIAVVSYLVVTVVIGYLDERFGVWKHELEYTSSLNPLLCRIHDGVEYLKLHTKEMEK